MTSLVQSEDWSRFRGPNGRGISTADGFPVEFNRTKNLVWRTPVRPGKSSPVLTSKHVFLTGFENQTLYTQCFDRITGKLLWERSEPLIHKDGVNQLNHPAAITPVTDGANVYVFFKDYGLLSYSSGRQASLAGSAGSLHERQGIGAAPILAGESPDPSNRPDRRFLYRRLFGVQRETALESRPRRVGKLGNPDTLRSPRLGPPDHHGRREPYRRPSRRRRQANLYVPRS